MLLISKQVIATLMSNFAKLFMLLFIGVILTAVCLWLVGGKKQTFDALVSIDAPPKVVFKYLTDCEQRKRWQIGLRDCRQISETESFVGSRATTVLEIDGEQVEYEEETLRYQENEFLSIRATGPCEIATTIFRLEAVQGNTNFTYKVKTEPTGVSRLMAPFAEPKTLERIEEEVLKLKRLVEEENPNDAASQYNEDPTISAGAAEGASVPE